MRKGVKNGRFKYIFKPIWKIYINVKNQYIYKGVNQYGKELYYI